MAPAVPAALIGELADRVSGRVRQGFELSRINTFRIGGAAAVVMTPESAGEVADTVRLAIEHGVPYLAIGLGSNLLFDDAGVAGIVLRVAKELGTLDADPVEPVWQAGAGVPTPILAKKTAAAGLGGAQRLIGVPGTVGGGVFMNAGAHGQEYQDLVQSVDLVRPDGALETVPGPEVPWRYRSSGLDGIVVSARLRFTEEDPVALAGELLSCLKRRREGTPFDQPCCGSVFRNPSAEEASGVDMTERVTAGRLIETAGMKGFRIGGAVVSEMHANYIVNAGGATSADVRAVVQAVQDTVGERFGVLLHREVKYVSPDGLVT